MQTKTTNNDEIYGLIKGIAFFLDDGDRHLFAQYRLSAASYELLKHVHNHPGISPTAVSEKMYCHKSTVTRLVRKLEKENLIKRQLNPSDYRYVRLTLTAKGAALCQQVQTSHEKHVVKRMRKLKAGDKRLLIENLQSFLHMLQDENEVGSVAKFSS